MRDKLIELILEYKNYPQKTCPRYDETPCEGCKYDFGGECDSVGRLADHLIANKVFVLPEKLNDSWELCSGFIMRLFVADEAEIEKIKGEFELQKVKQILTDIRDYLVQKKKICDVTFDLEREMFIDTLLSDLTEYAEKLGVEL